MDLSKSVDAVLLAIHVQDSRRIRFVDDDGFLAFDVDLQAGTAEHHLEGEGRPVTWNEWIQMQYAVLHAQAAEAMHNGHPGSSHAGCMTAVLGIVVVVVQIQASCTEVHLVRLLLVPKLARENGVYARR